MTSCAVRPLVGSLQTLSGSRYNPNTFDLTEERDMSAICPECDSTLDLDEDDAEVDDELTCSECGALLRVATLFPLELELADEDELDEDDKSKDDDDDPDDDQEDDGVGDDE